MGGDSTNSAHAHDVFRKHPDWYDLLFDNANEAIFVYRMTPDGDPGDLLDVNQAACRMMGYTKDELLKLTMLDVSAPERYANYPTFKKKLDAEKHVVTETVKLTKDGRRIPTELSSHLFEIDGKPTVLSIVRDITERKKAEEVLKESEWWHRIIMDSANDAVFVYRRKPDGGWSNFIEVNQAACDVLGYSREELFKMGPADLVDADNMGRIAEIREQLLSEKRAVFETVDVAKDGSKIPMEISAHLFEIDNQTIVVGVARDVTERKKVEDALRENEERYRMLFNSSNDAVLVHYMDMQGHYGKYIEVNDVACQMFGYSRKQLLNMAPRDLVAPERRAVLDAKHTDIVPRDQQRVFESLLMCSDGARMPVEVSSHSFAYKEKYLVIVVVRDITERKKVDDELRDSQQRYYTLLNSAYDAVSLHELNPKGRPGRYVEVNDAFCQRVGYSRRELLKLTPWDVVERRGLPRIERLRDEILLKKGIVFDVTELAKDGKKTPVEITAKLLELKDKKYVLSVSRDVTERKRIEEELRESEERYRMLFNSSNDAVLVHYMDAMGDYGNYIEANDVACQMLGYSREQLLNMRPRDLVAPEKVDTLDPKRTRMFPKEKNTVFETVLASSDGRSIPVEVSSHGFDYKGRHLVIAVIRDITERKQVENQLFEAQEKLARSEKLAALGQLASGIAHDMGTPLTVIANVADYLREALGDTDEIVKTQLDRLERQADIANHIASDLLDFAKVREPELEEITMDLVVTETLGQVDIPDNVDVAVEYQKDACAVWVDFDQMVRVLTNIIGNAVLAMPDGGELTINTKEADGCVLMEIKDTGVGISAYHLNKIFEPLFTTRSKQGSTGIGLAICKSIVEAHNGVIEVTSEEYVGTTFTIKLPCVV